MFYKEDVTDAAFANSNEMSVDMSVQIHVLFSVGYHKDICAYT